jgi:hypothetical protein
VTAGITTPATLTSAFHTGDDNNNDVFERFRTNLHDELNLLLLEGVMAERPDNDESKNTKMGSAYRSQLRKFLKWPLGKLRMEQFMTSLTLFFARTRFGIGTSGPSRSCVANPVLRFEHTGLGVGILR